MRHTRGQTVQVETLEEFEARIAAGARELAGWEVKTVDLTAHGPTLAECRVAGTLFLGCAFAPGVEDAVRSRGAIVFPVVPGVPVDAYRTRLYSATELYDTPDYQESLDARAYAWSRDLDPDLVQALHDHSIDIALSTWVRGRRMVGVMGGHAIARGTPEYAAAARLGATLGGTCVVATGGGPGAMEAANLGGYLGGQPVDAVADALRILAAVPSFRPDVGAWVRAAFEVLDRHPVGSETLGIPTWHYGHEPPNPFGTAIAKYFRNATREAILLEVCDRGIVFLPGAAGTVQEVFQDACENYYADESSTAPMVLVGREHWTTTVPAWPLLQALARGRPMEPHVHLVDTVEEAAELVLSPNGR